MPIVSVTPLGSNSGGVGAAIGQIIDYLERGARLPEPNATLVSYYADTPTSAGTWRGRGVYKEPEMPATQGSLPAGWTWATLDQLQSFLRNGIATKPTEDRGLPILRISAVRALSMNLEDIRYLSADTTNPINHLS